jgi:selenide, water dikinase
MSSDLKIKLTQFSRGAGCGCKIAPEILTEILKSNESAPFENLLVGNSSRDDAAVLDLENGTALISTSDFFMPMVDDAFDFGRIAATNAISDVYAMGGKPILAIGILGWPIEKIAASVASQVIAGARKVCEEANIPLAGGHSIDSTEPFFGLSVNGIVAKENIKQNNSPRESDLLFLTKPLGTGILSSALKREKLVEGDYNKMIEYMTQLNRIGEQLGKLNYVHALTDVTGFGLLGHLKEMIGENFSGEIYFDKIKKVTNLKPYLDQYIYPDMTMKVYSGLASYMNELTPEQIFILCDPQTSGGLLVSVAPESANDFQSVLKKYDLEKMCDEPVGKILSKSEKLIEVR